MALEATKQRWTRSPSVWAAEKDPMNPIDRNGSGASPRKKYDENRGASMGKSPEAALKDSRQTGPSTRKNDPRMRPHHRIRWS